MRTWVRWLWISALLTHAAGCAPQSMLLRPTLAYVPDGISIWLVRDDGSERKRLTNDDSFICENIIWAPTGEQLACIGMRPAISGWESYAVRIFALDGQLIKEIGAANAFAWSPTGRYFVATESLFGPNDGPRRFLVGAADGNIKATLDGVAGRAVWSLDGTTVAFVIEDGKAAIYEVANANLQRLDFYIDDLLAWLNVNGAAALLIANDVQIGEYDITASYKAHLVDLKTRKTTRVPQLDNSVPFWILPDMSKAIFTDGGTMSILDFSSLKAKPFNGSSIGYPSESIPAEHLAFSSVGRYFYFANVFPLTTYQAQINDGSVSKIAEVPNGDLSVRFSPNRAKIAFVSHEPSVLWIGNIDGSDARKIDTMGKETGFTGRFAWSP
jgi:hypothetical protein